MRRLLPVLLCCLTVMPAIADAAGTDIVADTIEREADGSIVASGNVVIEQRSSREIRNLQLHQADNGRIAADFELGLQPAGRAKPIRRRILFEKQGGRWLIVADRPLKFIESNETMSDAAVLDRIEAWRNSWNRRDLDAYLALYDPSAYPDAEYPSRDMWIAAIKRDFARPPVRSIHADRIRYSTSDQRIEATGHVRLETAGARLEAESADVDNNRLTGNIRQATLYLPDGQRIKAKVIRRLSDTLFEAEDVRYTACPEDAESWALLAQRARLDQQEGMFVARNSRFEVVGIPVLYSPYLTQPLKRKSGLLTPQLAVGKRRGTELALPIYLAPADNWDVTYTPHNMTARGFMSEGEFRHVSPIGSEKLAGEVIHDKVTGYQRSRLQGDIAWTLPADIHLDASGDHVSDNNYLADYARDNDAARRYLQSSASLSQQFRYGDWALSTTHQQDLRLASNATVLQILPRLESRVSLPLGGFGRLHFDQQTTRFNRRLGQDGWRADLNPYLEVPWELDGGGISATLTAGMHHLRYWLGNTATGQPKRLSRNSYDTSLEVRSDFERISASGHWRHVISPVLRYDRVWAREQSGLTNFDSGLSQLTWSNLLSDNRFSGNDRIERSHRVTLLLENTLQSKTGDAVRDVLRIRAGVSRNLQRLVTDTAVQTQPLHLLSNILGDIVWTPVAGVRLFAAAQYDPSGKYFATTSGGAGWSGEGFALNASYHAVDRRFATASKLIYASGSIPLGGRWSAVGRWQYDALLKLTQQARFGIGYTHPCWKLQVEAYRLNRPSGTSRQSDIGASVLLEFKGLGSVGS